MLMYGYIYSAPEMRLGFTPKIALTGTVLSPVSNAK